MARGSGGFRVERVVFDSFRNLPRRHAFEAHGEAGESKDN